METLPSFAVLAFGSLFALTGVRVLTFFGVHRVGEIPIKISSRMMGLILVAVAVQFVVDGIGASGLTGR